MASSEVVNKSPSRAAPAAGRAGRAAAVLGRVRRTTVLLVLAAVVLSFNMVAGNRTAEDRPASFSEIAQADARAAAAYLARQARELSVSPAQDSPGTVPARGEAEPRIDEFSAQADVLAEQSVLLARAGGLRSGSVPAGVSAAGSASGADTAPAAAYVLALAASARSSLDAAIRADAGTARLLASTGAAQQVLALRAAGAAGLDVPAAWDPPGVAGTTGKCPDTTAGSGAAPPRAHESPEAAAADRPDAAGALQGAVDAEYGAAYAYEVAMARTSADSRAVLAAEREAHLAAGEEGVELLPELCLPALAPAPAYSLPASFRGDPAGALADLEASLPAVYADLAALGTGSVRVWAIDRLTELSTALYRDGTPVPVLPGVDAGTGGLPAAVGTP